MKDGGMLMETGLRPLFRPNINRQLYRDMTSAGQLHE